MKDFDLETFKIDPTDPTLQPARARRGSGHKSRRYFVRVPLAWMEKLEGASGQTYQLALHILFLQFRARGGSVAITNKGAGFQNRESKRRTLRELERRGLVRVDRQERHSPIVHVLVD